MNTFHTFSYKPPVRFELTTFALQIRYTTTVLRWRTTPLGFEPRKRDPKSPVIPFHHGVKENGEYFIPTFLKVTELFISATTNRVVGRTNKANALKAVASLTITGVGSHDAPVSVTLNLLLDGTDGGAEVAATEHIGSLGSGQTAAGVEKLDDL
jgi:hypothetical protein